ncbi:MAG: hypothetical protein EP332_00235 [Bacteroidetes bacterium]|nr:MAG: hypothetical protein EP332_00235 [Bacteroidota bacterium]
MRYTILSLIHKALRRGLSENLLSLQTLEFGQADHLKAFEEAAEFTLELLHHHAILEDTYVWPLVKEQAHSLIHHLEDEHLEDAKLIAQCQAGIKSLVAAQSELAFLEAQTRLVWDYSALLAFNLNHMNGEEQQIHPLLWENYSDAYLQQTAALVGSKNPPELFMPSLKLFIRACTQAELMAWYNGIPPEAPIKSLVGDHLGVQTA